MINLEIQLIVIAVLIVIIVALALRPEKKKPQQSRRRRTNGRSRSSAQPARGVNRRADAPPDHEFWSRWGDDSTGMRSHDEWFDMADRHGGSNTYFDADGNERWSGNGRLVHIRKKR